MKISKSNTYIIKENSDKHSNIQSEQIENFVFAVFRPIWFNYYTVSNTFAVKRSIPEALDFIFQHDQAPTEMWSWLNFDSGFFVSTQTAHNLHSVKNCNIPVRGFVRKWKIENKQWKISGRHEHRYRPVK